MRFNVRKSNHLSTAFLVMSVFIGMMVCAPWRSTADAPSTSTSITIVNNSNREIRHVYFSAPDQNNWGADQLGNSVIVAGGGSVTLTDVACSGSNLKVIAEDNEGCFLYNIVACSQATTWTITNAATRDCGSGSK